ncbi:hypothetical protein BN946_scf184804.g9 [Trametes cinnabarina]|uniref:Uncharacterized protein n=1 Tax=Pycnoporus cinnabarinus TaxID=5643 RepID=A0A060S8S6_PYCCI|nr:hypothetical protein BN946_scf184804.g9 [Trametes cinnabarina]
MPTPTKSARTSLRRTGSYLSLADMQMAEYTPLYGHGGPVKTYTSTDSLVIGQYDCRMRSNRRRAAPSCSSTVCLEAPKSKPKSFFTSRRRESRLCTSSPLAPVQRTLGEHPSLPYTKKREPDLYRTAIETRMRMSPIGRNILHMGPRVALSIISATEALELLVASHHDGEGLRSGELALSASWVDVSQEDWEMVDHSL